MSTETRREFLVRSAAFAAGATACASGQEKQPPLVRKNLATLKANSPEIQAFSTAYQAMMKIGQQDPNDPHGWIYQANIHGVTPSHDKGPDGVWNQCQHGTWWFFPWHRMYLYFFERIVRKYSGSSIFALPYWHWDDPSGSQLVLNSVFLDGGPLFIPERSSAANGGQPIDEIANILDDPRSGKKRAMRETHFFLSANQPAFGGPLSQQPTHSGTLHGRLEGDGHDIIHVDTGGDKGWMSFPDLAARDPIFWFHHSNVDRIWIEWLKTNDGRANPDPNTPNGKLWAQQSFSFFDENKKKVTLTPAEVLETTKLGYVYDMFPDFHAPAIAAAAAAVAPAEEAKKPPEPVAESSERGLTLRAKPLRVTIKLNEAAKGHVRRMAMIEGAPPAKVSGHLTLRGIKAEANRASIIQVYLNLPDGAKPPGTKDPHYAGSVTLFAHEHDDVGLDASLPITEALQDLRKAGLWKEGDDLSVTLVQRRPSEKNTEPPDVPFDKVTLDVAQ